MTSRSIVLSTAALLMLSAAAPVELGFSPTAAFAQTVSAEVAAALSADPAQLEAKQLSENIRVLRDAIQAGAFEGADRKAAQQKVKAYREVLQQLRAERKEAKQDDQQTVQETQQAAPETQAADQPASDGVAEEQDSERKAERQAERAQRRAERKAKAAAEQQAQSQQAETQQAETQQAQTQKTRTQQAQATTGVQLSPEMTAALRDNRPAAELERGELRERIQTLRGIVQSGALSEDERGQVQARMRADREVLQSVREASQDDAAPEPTPEQQPRQATAEETPQAEVEQRAQAIMADNRPADDLDDKVLRKRLTENRAILGTGKLSKAEERELRKQLREDRAELRGRVASEQEVVASTQEEDDDKPAASSQSGSESGSTSSSQSSSENTTEVNTTTNVNVIIQQNTPPDRLSERDIERRVRALNRALKEERLARRDAEIAMEMVERDRRELRERLHAERERRRERRRSDDDVFIEFEVGYRPPPVIFAAEAMPRDIELQLIAPPARRTSRAYTVQEIATNQDVREMMPGIDIDTLNFDFGSAEVRPEEIDKLDAIAEVIERIVEERPNEVFLIEGHTDAVGSDQANQALSQHRSQAVVEALLDYYAIDPENLQSVGLGERFLKVWTEDPEEENRRVTIRRITPLLAGGQG